MILVMLYVNKKNLTGSARSKTILLLFIAGVLFAVISEGIQLYLPYRSFNIMDVIFNVSGVVLGAICIPFIQRIKIVDSRE